MEEIESSKNFVFNSPLEVGLRLLFIFNKTSKSLDLQRLIYYTYLLIHSGDIPDSPKSIHADLPRRSFEMLVNREVIQKSLTLLIMKDLIAVKYSNSGIQYHKNKNTGHFLGYFESEYSKELQKRADWLCSRFDKLTDKKLSKFMDENAGKWGSEFSVIYDEIEEIHG
jgi:hypothetical protein